MAGGPASYVGRPDAETRGPAPPAPSAELPREQFAEPGDGPVNRAVKVRVHLVDEHESGAGQGHFDVAPLVRPSARAVHVADPHRDALHPRGIVRQPLGQPLPDVAEDGVGQVEVQSANVQFHVSDRPFVVCAGIIGIAGGIDNYELSR